MIKPPKIIKSEYNVLKIIAKGHPNRTMTIKTLYGIEKISPLTWDEIQNESNMQFDDFAGYIAHLVAYELIKSATIRAGLIQRIFGKKDTYYFWPTDAGKKFLIEYPIELIPDKIELPNKKSMTPEDIEEAVDIFENNCTDLKSDQDENVQWANKVLDQDIKNEIKIAVNELETMWDKFETNFGHRGPARNEAERKLRDPIVKRTEVRVIRALDDGLTP